MVIRLDHIRPDVQALAKSTSTGQGKLRARYCITVLKKSMAKEAEKTIILCSENQINDGNVEIKPTSDAPIPIETKRAGSAQQIKVLKEVNKLKNGRRIAL
jgi:hypothetical protein